MKFAIIVFPGSDDVEMYHAVKEVLGEEAELVGHDADSLEHFDGIILPGGFAYGDYLRPGALAVFAKIMNEVKKAAEQGKPVLGVGNGFQVLLEAGLLPGAVKKNESLHFICRTEKVKVLNNETMFTSLYGKGEVISLPIAHESGNYHCDNETLQKLKANNMIVFTYENNPNGSMEGIAGIVNEKGNVLGMMPRPERATEEMIGGTDGLKLFQSIVKHWRETVHGTNA